MVEVNPADLSIMLLAAVIIGLALVMKLAYDLKEAIMRRSDSINTKLINLEHRSLSMKRDLHDLHTAVRDKADYADLEKRVNGLTELIKSDGKKR